jgi:signal transduction histidine kinase
VPVRRGVVVTDLRSVKQAEASLRTERKSLRRMLQASDRDRELIAYEIHNGITQTLLGALMQVEAYRDSVGEKPQQAGAMFDAGLRTLRHAIAEARNLTNRTRTPVLSRFGLAAAVADFIDQFGERPNAPEITYQCEVRFGRLEPALENTVFRVAQEAITNACLHSRADRVRVTLMQQGEDIALEVCDDGIGFDVDQVDDGHFGLDSIRQRTRLLGNDLVIDSAPDHGTCIRATFPLMYAKIQDAN